MGQNAKSGEMLVTRKVPKTKFHQVMKSKTQIKDTSQNANRKRAWVRLLNSPRKESKAGSTRKKGGCGGVCFQRVVADLFLPLPSPRSLPNPSAPLVISSGSRCLTGVSSLSPRRDASAPSEGFPRSLAHSCFPRLGISSCRVCCPLPRALFLGLWHVLWFSCISSQNLCTLSIFLLFPF